MGPETRFLTESEASTLLGISRKTAQGWRHRRVGPPYVRFGTGRKAAIRYEYGTLLAWARTNTVVTTGAPSGAA